MTNDNPRGQASLGDYGANVGAPATTENEEQQSDESASNRYMSEYESQIPTEPPRVKRRGEPLDVGSGPDKGKVAGELCDVLGPDGPGTDDSRPAVAIVKQARRSVHRIRKVGTDGGYAISTSAYRRAILRDARLVIVSDTETGTVYEWHVDDFQNDAREKIPTPEPQKYGTVEAAIRWPDHSGSLYVPRGGDASDGFESGNAYRDGGDV